MRSPLSLYSEQSGHGVLDLSLSSLRGIDAYAGLIAPSGAPRHEDAAWARRISVFVGGYVGEVLRDLVGGTWMPGGEATGPEDYRLSVQDAFEVHPVKRTYDRLVGDSDESLTDYVQATARRASKTLA
jgi:hypothetical protein